MYNPFKCHYSFSEDEQILAFKYKMLTIMLYLIIVFSLYFALLYTLEIRKVVDLELYSRYFHAGIGLILLLVLKRYRSSYTFVTYAMMLVTIVLFAMMMVNVTFDSFRMVWFHILVVASFVTHGMRLGITTFLVSLIALFITFSYFIDDVNQESIVTVYITLFILFLVMFFYTRQVSKFEARILQSNKILEDLASHDTLTGILNRRVFLEMANKYLSESRRKGEIFYFLMLDIDFFKKINDTYGHLEGDQVLKTYTKLINALLRENDLLGRLGGEEFGVIVLVSDVEAAIHVAEKIRKTLEDYQYRVKDDVLTITVSIGISRSCDGAHLEDIMHNADSAMYIAKESGRNRVYIDKACV